jgi:branched-chain amino acid transport system permease protein
MTVLLQSSDLSVLPQFIANGIANGSVYALIAVGYTLVYGVLQLINFAHGEVYMLGAYFSYYPARWLGYTSDAPEKASLPFYVLGLMFLVAITGCSLLGAIIERFAYRPLRGSSRLAALITAIGVSLLLQNLAMNRFGADPRYYPEVVEQTRVSLGIVSMTNTKLIIIVVAFISMVGLHLFVQKTRPGMAMRACSHDLKTAQLMGINVNRTIAMTFMLGSAMAAIAGILVAMDQYRLTPMMGLMMGLKAFVAAVLGGIGSIPGAALGGLLLGLLEGVVTWWDSRFTEAVAFAVLIVVLLVKPTGLLGKSGREKV